MSNTLRIVSFNAFPFAHGLVRDWAERNHHRIVMVVIPPPHHGERYGTNQHALLSALKPGQDVLISSHLRTIVAPALTALEPDLIISATFPLRIPETVTTIPRYGALNLHPAPLPRGRGPNPQRLFYEGDLSLTSTVHRIAPNFDTGPIMGSCTKPVSEDISAQGILNTWATLFDAALDTAVARAVEGDPGDSQDESMATYAAHFTEEESRVSWHEPVRVIQRKVAALNVMAPRAKMDIDGAPVIVSHARNAAAQLPVAAPGHVFHQDAQNATIQAADGAVEVTFA